MATESERLQTVPDFEKDDKGNFIKPEDPVAFEAKEQRVRERFVNVAQAKILRERLGNVITSQVNHYQYVYPQRFMPSLSRRVKPSCIEPTNPLIITTLQRLQRNCSRIHEEDQ